jgi:starch phosphorylase
MMSSSEEKSQATTDFTMNGSPKIAYFSMEIGINERIPTYSGGLGVLAGDTLKSCADLNIPIVGITLLSENGYFYQKIDDQGNQIELPYKFNIEDFLEPLPTKITVPIEGRDVKVRMWYFTVKGINDYLVPVFFLDTNIEENSEWDRSLTKYLYGGDLKYRLAQEIVLGVGGVRAVHKLGYKTIEKYHMNEGHAAFGTLELYKH